MSLWDGIKSQNHIMFSRLTQSTVEIAVVFILVRAAGWVTNCLINQQREASPRQQSHTVTTTIYIKKKLALKCTNFLAGWLQPALNGLVLIRPSWNTAKSGHRMTSNCPHSSDPARFPRSSWGRPRPSLQIKNFPGAVLTPLNLLFSSAEVKKVLSL